MNELLTLSPDAVEQIARRVVALLREDELGSSYRYVDAATLANELAVERDWVYAHAEELGAIRLGGPKGRLRFDLIAVRQQLRVDETAPSQRSRPRLGPGGNRNQSGHKVGSPEIQRRASGRTPARSPKQHRPGGNPDDEA